MKKLKHREFKLPDQDHRASTWQSQISHRGNLMPEPTLLTTALNHFSSLPFSLDLHCSDFQYKVGLNDQQAKSTMGEL